LPCPNCAGVHESGRKARAATWQQDAPAVRAAYARYEFLRQIDALPAEGPAARPALSSQAASGQAVQTESAPAT